MSDAPANTGGLTTDAVPAGAPQSPPVPAAAAPPAASAPPAEDPLGEIPEDQAVFSRSYVEKVRGEAQRYREEARAAQRYDEVFGVYDEADRGVWLDLARTWATDPNRAAQIMQQIAGSVLGEADAGTGQAGAPGPGDPPPGAADELDRPEQLTPQRVQELIDQQFTAREAKQAEARAIDDIYGEMREGGFDPISAEGMMVLWNASNVTGGDITKAMAMANTYKQSIIDGYVQGRSSGTVPMPTANGVQATAVGEPIKNLEDAKRAADAFLRERRGA